MIDDATPEPSTLRRNRGRGGWLLVAFGVLLALAALVFIGGGAYLIRLGGSPYFLLTGLALLASGVLVARRDVRGFWLYAIIFAATVAWALWDAGIEFWPLVSRLYAPAVLLALMCLAAPFLRRSSPQIGRTPAFVAAGVVLVGLGAAAVGFFTPHNVVRGQSIASTARVAPGAEQREWRHYGNTTHGRRFAALDQINRDNVEELEVAWTFRTGDIAHSGNLPEGTVSEGDELPADPEFAPDAEDQNTPIQVGDTLYICTPRNIVIAVDADSGRERWRFDPRAISPNWQRCRGVAYHGPPADAPPAPQPTAAAAEPSCARRILLNTLDARLIALDAGTGQPCSDFGSAGEVDLKLGLGPVRPGFYNVTSAPLIAGDLVVVGGRVIDNNSTDVPSGVVRAYDVRTGALAWAFDPGNPGITGAPPPGQTYSRGTPNVWAPMSYDERLGLVYLPFGNPAPDLWGGDRSSADEAYTSTVVAVDVRTGRERWKFQTTHHDLWDFDVPSQPLLYEIPNGRGGTVPALIQTTKAGQIFVLNRVNGRPIFPVEERPVPRGVAPGERWSPTQPFSVGMPQIGVDHLTESDMWGATPFDQLLCRITFRGMRFDGIYTPPSTDVSLSYPGSLGGMNWGSAAVDETNHYLIVNDMRLGLWIRLLPRAEADAPGAAERHSGLLQMAGSPYGVSKDRFMSPLGIPCQKPPFGTLSAIDLRSGRLAWQVPVGTVQDTGPMGLKMGLPIPIGLPTLGGPMTTQGGLVFFAGSQDYYLRALDVVTGDELWKARLPVGAQATPMTYRSPRTGRQYVVISAGGARMSPDRGDYVIAYALPRN